MAPKNSNDYLHHFFLANWSEGKIEQAAIESIKIGPSDLMLPIHIRTLGIFDEAKRNDRIDQLRNEQNNLAIENGMPSTKKTLTNIQATESLEPRVKVKRQTFDRNHMPSVMQNFANGLNSKKIHIRKIFEDFLARNGGDLSNIADYSHKLGTLPYAGKGSGRPYGSEDPAHPKIVSAAITAYLKSLSTERTLDAGQATKVGYLLIRGHKLEEHDAQLNTLRRQVRPLIELREYCRSDYPEFYLQ